MSLDAYCGRARDLEWNTVDSLDPEQPAPVPCSSPVTVCSGSGAVENRAVPMPLLDQNDGNSSVRLG